MDDWTTLVSRHGWRRFEAGLRQTWLACRFFPKPVDIIENMSEPLPEDSSELERIQAHRADMERRIAAGEPVYSLSDVLKAVKEAAEKKRIPDFKERQSGMEQ